MTTAPSIDTTDGALRILLRCGSCRFAAFYFLPFYAGIQHHGSGHSLSWAIFGAVYWFTHSLGTELSNRIADRDEDEINRPERTALCHRIGFPTLTKIMVASWVLVGLLDVALVVVSPSWLLAGLLLAAGVFGIGYSFGPHLKRHSVTALLILTFPFSGTFLIGWAASHPDTSLAASDFWSDALPFAVLLGSLIASIGGAKDLTDTAGDTSVAYRSAWIKAIRAHRRTFRTMIIAAPFGYIGVGVACGILGPLFLALCALAPVSWWFVKAAAGAASATALEAVREVAYAYCGLFIAIAVCMYQPSGPVAVATGASIAYWLIASRWLHWGNGLRLGTLKTFVEVGPAATRLNGDTYDRKNS